MNEELYIWTIILFWNLFHISCYFIVLVKLQGLTKFLRSPIIMKTPTVDHTYPVVKLTLRETCLNTVGTGTVL